MSGRVNARTGISPSQIPSFRLGFLDRVWDVTKGNVTLSRLRPLVGRERRSIWNRVLWVIGEGEYIRFQTPECQLEFLY